MGTRSKRRQLACFDAPAMSAGMTEHPARPKRPVAHHRRVADGAAIRLFVCHVITGPAPGPRPWRLAADESESRNASEAESACFAIADISGYTHFLSGVELDHAQDIIADIMDTLVRALRPPFRLAKFEGDAAFVYALADKVDGPLLQDSIEQAYFAFRKRLRSIKQASSCECQACSRMQSLDVKFVIYHGEFIRQKMSGREELVGRDVILVHRLLKNDIGKTFGPHAYALSPTPACERWGSTPRRRAFKSTRRRSSISAKRSAG